jgi:hypothetical protein
MLKDTSIYGVLDELPIELIKAAGEAAITVLTALCQQIWVST